MIKSKIKTIQIAEVGAQFTGPLASPTTREFIAVFDAQITQIAKRYDLEFQLSKPTPGISVYRVSSSHAEHFRRGMVRIERLIEHSRGRTRLVI